MKITGRKSKSKSTKICTQPVSLMLFFNCVQRLSFCHIRTVALGSYVTQVFLLGKGLNLSMKQNSYDYSDPFSWKILKKETYESSNLIFVVIFQGCKEKYTEEMSCWVKKRMNIHRQRINSFSINRWQLQSTLVLAVRWKICCKNEKLNSLQNYKTE